MILLLSRHNPIVFFDHIQLLFAVCLEQHMKEKFKQCLCPSII